ncbi:MAG: Na+/H+ antiporter [Deltaproteobacteria bacterium]|nr:Na+/H+ antiporter [Deltaproteobacteria bacterium]MCW5806071.1 Na+/H+ antiporter [Deltaproteobacteria bacterium]
MTARIQTLFLLFTLLVAVDLGTQRLKVARSILLVIAGCALALVPGLPRFDLAPELVLLVILPPLIYTAGVAMSWREFRLNLRPIALLAVGCVVFTTWAVAAAAHWLLGMEWALGFLLGAIVSPPDLVAPVAIARRLRMPRRLLVVLEGEGLVNDATALILYRFAVAAVSLGAFSLGEAVGMFALIVAGEIVYGLAVGWVSLRVRRWARNPRVELTLSLMTPYACFWLPQHLGGSGVIATVAAGLYVSWKGPLLISSSTRLQGVFFWNFITFVVEGLVFLLMGLQMRTLVERVSASTDSSLTGMVAAAALTTVIVIAARFVWVFAVTDRPRLRRGPAPEWQTPFMIAFTGVRGVVSLAAALAIPTAVASGAPFPDRDLILFVTFGVIIVTLVGQGLSLPPLVDRLGLARSGVHERRTERTAELAVRAAALDTADRRLEEIAAARDIPADVRTLVQSRQDHHNHQLPRSEDGLAASASSSAVRRELIAAERVLIYERLRDGSLTDEARRRIERELDLEEEILGTLGELEEPL